MENGRIDGNISSILMKGKDLAKFDNTDHIIFYMYDVNGESNHFEGVTYNNIEKREVNETYFSKYFPESSD